MTIRLVEDVRTYTTFGVTPPPPTLTWTSTGTYGSRLSEMFGGPESGSWMTTKLPDNTAVHVDSAAAVAILVGETLGTTYYRKPANPWINRSRYTATVSVVPVDQALKTVVMTGSRSTQGYGQKLKRVFSVGVPIPDNLQPTNDTDSTIIIYQPDWTNGDPLMTGSLWELWQAKSPEQNGKGYWTCSWGGRMRGANVDKRGHWRDYLWSSNYNDPQWQVNGTGMEKSWGAMATSVPMTPTMITKRDLVRGVIDHPIGFMLDPVRSTDQSTHTWPAQRHDSSSRRGCPQGARFRLPAGYSVGSASIGTLASGDRRTTSDLLQMVKQAMRDYGLVFIDTAQSGGMTLRCEPGSTSLMQIGMDPKSFMQSLPWNDVVRLATGSDSLYTPTA